LLRGQRELVGGELAKMFGFLLEPVGVASPLRDLGEAVASYIAERAEAENALGVAADPMLGRQVTKALQRHGLLA